jgi:hypothetical protein
MAEEQEYKCFVGGISWNMTDDALMDGELALVDIEWVRSLTVRAEHQASPIQEGERGKLARRADCCERRAPHRLHGVACNATLGTSSTHEVGGGVSALHIIDIHLDWSTCQHAHAWRAQARMVIVHMVWDDGVGSSVSLLYCGASPPQQGSTAAGVKTTHMTQHTPHTITPSLTSPAVVML